MRNQSLSRIGQIIQDVFMLLGFSVSLLFRFDLNRLKSNCIEIRIVASEHVLPLVLQLAIVPLTLLMEVLDPVVILQNAPFQLNHIDSAPVDLLHELCEVNFLKTLLLTFLEGLLTVLFPLLSLAIERVLHHPLEALHVEDHLHVFLSKREAK